MSKKLHGYERRKYRRFPSDGDLSLGGCFVHSLSAPRVGDSTSVSFVTHEGQKLDLEGTVVHVEPRIGFSVQFHEIAAADAHDLLAFVEHLQKA